MLAVYMYALCKVAVYACDGQLVPLVGFQQVLVNAGVQLGNATFFFQPAACEEPEHADPGYASRNIRNMAVGILGCLSAYMGKIGSPTREESYETVSDGQPVGCWAVTWNPSRLRDDFGTNSSGMT